MYRLSHPAPKRPISCFWRAGELHCTGWKKNVKRFYCGGSRVSRSISLCAPRVMLGGRLRCSVTSALTPVRPDPGWHWILRRVGGNLDEAPAESGWDATTANQQNSHDRTSLDDSWRHGHSSSVYPKSGCIQGIGHNVWFMSARLTSQLGKKKSVTF